MKNFKLFVGLFLVILMTTNCKKESITPNNTSNKPVFNATWEPYVGIWKLIKVTDSKNVQQNFSPASITFNNDLTILTNSWFGSGKSALWIIVDNTELHMNIYNSDYTKIVYYDILDIKSVSSTTLILANHRDMSYNNSGIYTFQKQ
jgi:hypothetical protein